MKKYFTFLLFAAFMQWARADPNIVVHVTLYNDSDQMAHFLIESGDNDYGNGSSDTVDLAAHTHITINHVMISYGDFNYGELDTYELIKDALPLANLDGTVNSEPLDVVKNTGLDTNFEFPLLYPQGEMSVTYHSQLAKIVWRQSPVGDDYFNPDVQKGPVSQELFREGVTKIIESMPTGGAGGGDTTQSESLSAQQNSLLANHEGALSVLTSVMVAAGNAAGGEMRSLLPTAPTGLGYEIDATGAPTLSGGILAVQLPETMGGVIVDFNPFTDERLGGVFVWFRTALAWLALYKLGMWIWKEFAVWVRGYSTVRQATGNTVAGSAGQGTAMIAAALITVAVVVGVTALVGWTFGEMSIPRLISNLTTSPFATIPVGILWILDHVFPVAIIVSCLVARASFTIYGTTLFGVAMSTIRFFVP